MSKMGLEVVSFTIQEVRDNNEYITNMGRPDIARIKRDAEVATAEADRDLDIKRANFLETSKKAQAQADKAYEIETNRQQQAVMLEQVRIQQVEREAQVKVQDAEIARRERELIATVLIQAEVERLLIDLKTRRSLPA